MTRHSLLFQQHRQSPGKFWTQAEAQTLTTWCFSKAHRGIPWFSPQPFSVPKLVLKEPLGQVFPSQQMKKVLVSMLSNSAKGFWLAQEGTDIIIVGWRITLASHVTIKKHKALKGQMSCQCPKQLVRETDGSLQKEQWDGGVCRASTIHVSEGWGPGSCQWHGSAIRFPKCFNLL